MLIRELTEFDAKEFWNLRLKALKESPEAFGASYEEEMNISLDKHILRFKSDFIVPPEENFILGAFDDYDNIIGIVGFRRERREKLRHKSNVWGMYVMPELRKNGIGKLLLSELLNKSKLLEGLEQVNLSVVSSNLNAKKLYMSLGFETYGLEKNALKVGEQFFDEDCMVLFIK